jgi:hypothetical protein
LDQLCGKLGDMFFSNRGRMMLAALVFALGWAVGAAAHHQGLSVLAALCLLIGSIALSYFVWAYHRAWRLRPASSDPKKPTPSRIWPGISMDGLTVRPEYMTAALALLICVFGMYKYFQVTAQPSNPILQSPPAVVLPEARPLQ